MTDFQKATGTDSAIARAVKLYTDKRVTSLPSPIFPFSNSITTGGQYELFDFTQHYKSPANYAPFNNAQVINASIQTIRVYFGDQYDNYDTVPANSIKNYDKNSMAGGVAQLRIYIDSPTSTTISVGDIMINVFNSGVTQDDLAAKQYNFLEDIKGVAYNPAGFLTINHG